MHALVFLNAFVTDRRGVLNDWHEKCVIYNWCASKNDHAACFEEQETRITELVMPLNISQQKHENVTKVLQSRYGDTQNN